MGGSVPRISQLQGQPQSVSGSGSVPRILSGIHTPSGLFGMNPYPQHKNLKNPDLPTFSGELPTPKGEAEYDNYIFQLKLLRTSYTDDAIRNVVVATVRGHAKITI